MENAEQRTPRQTDVPGTERKKNPKLEKVMEELDDARKAKTKASNKHKEADQRAIDALKAEGLTEYTSLDLGMTITVDDTTHAKLSAYKAPKGQQNDPPPPPKRNGKEDF